MTKIEEKSLTAQLELYQEIQDIDKMILYYVKICSTRVFDSVIKNKIYIKEDQTTVELTVDEFNKVRLLLARLGSEDGLEMIDTSVAKYIYEKEVKQKVLNKLR